MEQKNLIWESYLDGSIFYDEESIREYAEENIDDIDICDAMCSFSKMEIFEALNEEKNQKYQIEQLKFLQKILLKRRKKNRILPFIF